MLLGAHVSTSGGLLKVLERAEETTSDAIQVFNQSPRMWRPTNYSEEDFAAFREAREGTRLEAVMVHMIYLINPASGDKEMRKKSLNSLVHALRVSEGMDALGVVVHPGALKTDTRDTARKRAIGMLKEALAQTDDRPDHLREHRRLPPASRARLRRDGRADREDRQADGSLHRQLPPARHRLRRAQP